MENWYDRTVKLVGETSFEKINNSCVGIVGLGGVGGACCEALCRCGVGKLVIMDFDDISLTNINRQIIATTKTIGQKKSTAMKNRLLEINPNCEIVEICSFYDDQTKEIFFENNLDFVVDAIDTIKSKISLAAECQSRNVKIIASLGTGNRLNPTQFLIGKVEDTKGCGCGLARVMRHEYTKNSITDIDVLYSAEMPIKAIADEQNGRHSPASISFCPPVAGYIIASHVIKNIIE